MDNQRIPIWQIILIGVLTWGFAGLMSVTVLPFENYITSSVNNRLLELLPDYFNWSNISYLSRYSSQTLFVTGIILFIFNGFIGPVIEELFFRGYLTRKISRYKNLSPVIITILFSLYHFWLPFNNIFRILAFLPAFYITWRKRNIYIAIICHCLSNVFSSVTIILMMRNLLY